MKRFIIVFLFSFIGFLDLQAQEPGPTPGDPDEGIPIDGGASFLAAAGAAYGIKKYRDQRKSRQEENEV